MKKIYFYLILFAILISVNADRNQALELSLTATDEDYFSEDLIEFVINETDDFPISQPTEFESYLDGYIEEIPLYRKSNLRHGERLTFELRYGIISAGEAVLSIEKTTFNNNDVWRFVATAQTNSFFDRLFRVRDFVESIATIENKYSLRFTKRLHEGNYRQHRIHRNYLSQNFSIYSRFRHSQGTFEDTRIEIPSDTYDPLSAFYFVRTQDLMPGQDVRVHITADGKNYPAMVRVVRRETINTIFGRIPCIVVQPDLDGDAIFKQTGTIHIWLTDDEHKIPVQLASKVIFGSFRAVLTKSEIVQ
jgi:hypothetical protein